MNTQKGFSMVGLMAVAAIVAIIAVVSLPVYNQYIERTKVSKEISVIGTYKNDIASCFMKDDSLEDCNDGESGIHPGLDNEGKILSLDVFKGNIVMIIDAQNHMEDVEPVELMYVVNPNVDATFPTLDWTLYCNDYSSDNNALVKECEGLVIDRDGDGVPNEIDTAPDDETCCFDYNDNDELDQNPDRDGDGVLNENDAFPDDKNESSDLDGDGTGDNADLDRDGDGVNNGDDVYPDDPNASSFLTTIEYKARGLAYVSTPEEACENLLATHNAPFNQIDALYKTISSSNPPSDGFSEQWGMCVIGSSWHFKTSPSKVYWKLTVINP